MVIKWYTFVMFFIYISSDNQVKNILFLKFQHLSLSLYYSSFLTYSCLKKFILFLHYNGKIYIIKTNVLGTC